MTNKAQIDLSLCAKEPIHTPDAIQPFAYLLIIDAKGNVQGFSENALTLFPNLNLNKKASLKSLLPSTYQDTINLIQQNKSERSYLTCTINKKLFNSMLYDSNQNLYLVVFEPQAEDKLLPKLITLFNFIQEHHISPSYYEHLMQRFRQALNIDRVMLYKFHTDGHGEVIAESKDAKVGSYLKQHFPEHDIPKQARELYIKNKLRLIEDRNNQNIPLIYDPKLDKIDLSATDIRAVSPIHIKYLENMGVICSLSISIVLDDKLWGLIACHGFIRQYFSLETRMLLSLLSNQLSNQMKLSQIAEEKSWTQQGRTMINQFLTSHDLNQLSLSNINLSNSMLNLIDNDCIVIIDDGKINSSDMLITTDKLIKLLPLLTNSNEFIFSSNKLLDENINIHGEKKYCGALVVCISSEPARYIIWLKESFKYSIAWAGKPNDPLQVDKNDPNKLLPRVSFDTWLEEVHDQSKPWTKKDIFLASQIRLLLSTRF